MMGRHLLRKRKVEPPRGRLRPAKCSNEYRNYADAYRDAAKALAGTRTDGGIWAMPIVSLYRHAIELMIKAILIEHGSEVAVCQHRVLNRSHSLKEQLPDLGPWPSGGKSS